MIGEPTYHSTSFLSSLVSICQKLCQRFRSYCQISKFPLFSPDIWMKIALQQMIFFPEKSCKNEIGYIENSPDYVMQQSLCRIINFPPKQIRTSSSMQTKIN